MHDHTFYKQVQISRSDIRPHIKWAVSLVILHMIISIFLWALYGYIWVNILTLSPRGGAKESEMDYYQGASGETPKQWRCNNGNRTQQVEPSCMNVDGKLMQNAKMIEHCKKDKDSAGLHAPL